MELILAFLRDALEVGLGCASEVAQETHQKYEGYKPHRHAAVDADVEKLTRALALLDGISVKQELVGYQMLDRPDVFYPATHKPTDINNFRPVYASVRIDLESALRGLSIEQRQALLNQYASEDANRSTCNCQRPG